MRDPFPVEAPEWLIRVVQPYAEAAGFPTLSLHAHEAIFAFLMYTFVNEVVSPIGSRLICPNIYNNFSRRTQINWNVHVTSFFQSVLISAFSLWIIFFDEDRAAMRARSNYEDRVWGYDGMNGLCQSFALGYFVWDFIICVWRVDIFGWGMVAHAISALSVFSFGYRPFVYFYAPVFLLYELSSPFLNVHWFCDKVNLTGSTIQAVNGALLTGTFFGCRLIWGNISSILVFYDIFRGVRYGNSQHITTARPSYTPAELLAIARDGDGQRMAFATESSIPLWLAAIYLASNLTLNSLNVFWFGKMIQTIRKRFDPPFGTKGVGPEVIHWEPQEQSTLAALEGDVAITALDHEHTRRRKLGRQISSAPGAVLQEKTQPNGSKSIEVQGSRTVRSRKA